MEIKFSRFTPYREKNMWYSKQCVKVLRTIQYDEWDKFKIGAKLNLVNTMDIFLLHCHTQYTLNYSKYIRINQRIDAQPDFYACDVNGIANIQTLSFIEIDFRPIVSDALPLINNDAFQADIFLEHLIFMLIKQITLQAVAPDYLLYKKITEIFTAQSELLMMLA